MQICLWCFIFIVLICLQQQSRPYNSMKEALSHNQLLNQQILDAYEEKKIKYFCNKRRRGHNPSLTRKQDIDTVLKDINDTYLLQKRQDSYPSSAFGTVQSIHKGQKRLGIGAIIHKNLVITLSSILQQMPQSNSEIWFIPFVNKEQRLLVKKVHPSNLQRRLSNKDSGDKIQFDRKVNLEAYLGSFSINFIPQPSKQALILGVTDSQRVYQQKINTHTVNYIVSYNLQKRNYLPGSLIVNYYQGQYQIIGIHVQNKANKGQGIYFSKQIWGHFSKLTFKGGQLNLSHEKNGRKIINYIKQLNVKRLVQLDLMNLSIGGEEIRVISKLKCELTSISLGYSKIRDEDISHLTNTQWNLQNLSLNNNFLTYQSIRTISSMKWKNMTYVDLNQNKIGSKGAAMLSKCDWRNLQQLHLHKAEIDDAACDKLRKARWPHLIIIQLKYSKITPNGVSMLANANWKMLQFLSLASSHLSYEGVKQVIRGSWPKLKYIQIQKNNIGKKVSELKNRITNKFHNLFVMI